MCLLLNVSLYSHPEQLNMSRLSLLFKCLDLDKKDQIRSKLEDGPYQKTPGCHMAIIINCLKLGLLVASISSLARPSIKASPSLS